MGREHQPVPACTLCVLRHSHGTTPTAWIHRPWHRLICPRHQQAAPDPRLHTPLHVGVVPELIAAHQGHQRLKRHPRAVTAWTTAHAITTRWHDHQQHAAPRWHHRLHQLIAANPRLNQPGTASATLLARELVTYPETVTLALTLTALPRPTRPHEAHTTTHGAACDALALIANRLGLDTLTPTTGDPLTAYLTRTRP
ncbi:hypothetical protein J7F03_39595 [Streptomyces sp. ISL-43]|uniref:hypothetical protein n=1 Tax=Streptomyces sp. ISL-43 TaxID=2819183 RepID=UPI001BEAE764|nr:hypothetical protein [Streptomyces sp. ISL-43]MBT2453029.1 hypothetical protein [Streptomyces sp. ISL-43]